ncbi:hypothetical protein [Paraburkholderia phenazinium]|uniref:hypothetical protein n=1 Tax=Paraburkholderia phenazinium TaxID=60549 RepID=UPI00115FE4A9|nr:hypothetical protein [Paraburkholderia phenazinium]
MLRLVFVRVACAGALVGFGVAVRLSFALCFEVGVVVRGWGVAGVGVVVLSVWAWVCLVGVGLVGVLLPACCLYASAVLALLLRLAGLALCGCVFLAAGLRAFGLVCWVVCLGFARSLLVALSVVGVTFVVACFCVFFALVMSAVGVDCASDLALCVLTLVLLHPRAALFAVVGVGWMVVRLERGMHGLGVGFGSGVVCAQCGDVVGAYVVGGASGVPVFVFRSGAPFFAIGIRFLVWAVVLVLPKLAWALGVRHRGCEVMLVAGSVAFWPGFFGLWGAPNAWFALLLEVVVGGLRSGLAAAAGRLLGVVTWLCNGRLPVGVVLASGGSGCDCDIFFFLVRFVERGRLVCVCSGGRLGVAELGFPVVCLVSASAAVVVLDLDVVLEVRVGVSVVLALVVRDVVVQDVFAVGLVVLLPVLVDVGEGFCAIFDVFWMVICGGRGGQRELGVFGFVVLCERAVALFDGCVLWGVYAGQGLVCRSCARVGEFDLGFALGPLLLVLPAQVWAVGVALRFYFSVGPVGLVSAWRRFFVLCVDADGGLIASVSSLVFRCPHPGLFATVCVAAASVWEFSGWFFSVFASLSAPTFFWFDVSWRHRGRCLVAVVLGWVFCCGVPRAWYLMGAAVVVAFVV